MRWEPLEGKEDLKKLLSLSVFILGLIKSGKIMRKCDKTRGYELRAVQWGKLSKACWFIVLSVCLCLQR